MQEYILSSVDYILFMRGEEKSISSIILIVHHYIVIFLSQDNQQYHSTLKCLFKYLLITNPTEIVGGCNLFYSTKFKRLFCCIMVKLYTDQLLCA
jgi:hypothetical protein